MKAITYTEAHALKDFSLRVQEVSLPPLNEFDVLVKIKAVGFNPVDYKIRMNRSASGPAPVILGWDASGIVERVGAKVSSFKVGDEVYYAGDLTRDGSYAEHQAVDARLIALKPKSLSFAEAAAVPLTTITAYEALILQSTTKFTKDSLVLVIGGAGGVGSIAIQLLKALTPAKVIATASREETMKWCKELGADMVVDHSKKLKEELRCMDVGEVDFVFSTTHTDKYYADLPELIKPFGHFTLIDDPASFDLKPFKLKSINANYEFMFTKSMFKFEMQSQGDLLKHVATMIDEKKLRTTLNRQFEGMTVENVKEAHTILESGASVGKMVMTI